MNGFYDYRLGDVCSRLSSGKSISSKDIFPKGSVPVYGGNGLRGYTGKANFTGECAIVGRQGAFCGNVRFFSGKAYMTEHAVVVCANEHHNTRYLAYLLSTMNLGLLSGQSAQPGLSVKTLGQQIVSLPSKSMQNKVVAVLSSIEDKIEANEKINHNLEQQAQAIYHSLFVSFDGTSANQLYETELGLIPEGWTVKPLSEVTTSIRTKVKDNDYRALSAINTGKLQLSEEYFNKQVFSKNISNYIVVEPNDFAYNPARINIGSIGMNNFGFTGCVSPVYVVVRTEPNYHYFLDFFVKTKRFSEEVKTRSSGSVRQSLSYADFGQIKIAYPPAEVVEQFNREYVARLKIIEHLKAENEKLASLRDTLLPKLMSGEIDVSTVQL